MSVLSLNSGKEGGVFVAKLTFVRSPVDLGIAKIDYDKLPCSPRTIPYLLSR